MKESLFRKKSLEQISSPDVISEYIKVANPSIWVILIAFIVLLIGFSVWIIFGELETHLQVATLSSGNEVSCFVKASDISTVQEGMVVTIDGDEYTVKHIAPNPVAADSTYNDYFFYVGNLLEGEWIYKVDLTGPAREAGVYSASITTESVSPLSFILN